jgi:hypothetical protein
MSAKYKFKKAQQIIQKLDAGNLQALNTVCRDIQRAEENLSIRAESILRACANGCKGLCCRNIRPDDIITLLDCVYIMTLESSMKSVISECLEEEGLFSSRCIFLENGQGPCIFPSNVRPEKCIVTFCGDISPVTSEIRHLRSRFNALSRFLLLQNAKSFKDFLLKAIGR